MLGAHYRQLHGLGHIANKEQPATMVRLIDERFDLRA